MSGAGEAASLTAALLARKGDAAPLGHPPRLSHAVRLAEMVGAPMPRRPAEPHHPGDRPGRISLRLDEARARQLRVLAAQLSTTRQALLLRAIDELVERHFTSGGGRCLCLKPHDRVDWGSGRCCEDDAGGHDVRD
jgi:hypothetical protein